MTSDNTSDSTARAGDNPENEQQDTPEADRTTGTDTVEETPDEARAEGEQDSGTASGGIADIVAGGAAVLSAGIGLVSITGSSFGDMLRTRQEIIGQLEATPGGGGEIEAFYGTPWNAVAMLNGSAALLAVIIGALVLALTRSGSGSGTWVKAVAVGGIVLGAIGVIVSAGMYFDWFAGQPEMPEMPMPGG
ncbi:hypothetical protein [Haloechinothrix sp. LS1_15]|uniref:hypothetical protein n=1 Tax=Haloechinothrix sp. LS1_15 TaxID=2652248 RepID=UPI0029474AFC|nr:hypothetical protein [Haloechinothrix sp. LS1_15]MDV6010942.1 hypothetical protein [Haloechinothrix sp. LS1_15]